MRGHDWRREGLERSVEGREVQEWRGSKENGRKSDVNAEEKVKGCKQSQSPVRHDSVRHTVIDTDIQS